MSISTDLTRLQSAKAAMKTAMQNKGVTVPDGAKLDAFAALIDSIPAGGGGYTAEAHVVTFAEDVTCAKGDMVELCDTAIQTPLCLGMYTYADNAAGDVNVPVLSFGASNELTGTTPTSGYACGTSGSSYAFDSKGYVMLYRRQNGVFNSEFNNGLCVKNGKLLWNNRNGLGFSGASAKFPAGTTYIFFILGAST